VVAGSGIDVPIGETGDAVVAKMQSTTTSATGVPGGLGHAAVGAAAAYLMGRTTKNPKYMIVFHDGLPSCSADRTATEETAAVAKAKVGGIRTFVVTTDILSFEPENTELNKIADAGGVPRPGIAKYYDASTSQNFVAHLTDIANRAICAEGR
jgi:hypothetical protein